jgi:hypothetical protein
MTVFEQLENVFGGHWSQLPSLRGLRPKRLPYPEAPGFGFRSSTADWLFGKVKKLMALEPELSALDLIQRVAADSGILYLDLSTDDLALMVMAIQAVRTNTMPVPPLPPPVVDSARWPRRR